MTDQSTKRQLHAPEGSSLIFEGHNRWLTCQTPEQACLIVKTVNCHDEMVDALKEAEEFLNIICKVICPNNPPPHGNEILGRMRQALEKAGAI